MIKLLLSDAERSYLEWNRGLTTDTAGNETLCGLTVDEAIDYLNLLKRDRPGKSADRNRFLVLHDKYEFARRSIILAEIDARQAGPKH